MPHLSGQLNHSTCASQGEKHTTGQSQQSRRKLSN